MEQKEIKRYDFAALYNMLGTNNPGHAMLSDNVAILMNGKKDKINKVIPYHTPVFLEEARIGVIRKGECDYIVNLIPHKIKAGSLAFLNRGSIIQIGSDGALAIGESFISASILVNPPPVFALYSSSLGSTNRSFAKK